MIYKSVRQLQKLLDLVEKGEPAPAWLLKACRESVEREREILEARAQRSYEFFEREKNRL